MRAQTSARFRNSETLRGDGSEMWWYGTFMHYVAGGNSDEAYDKNGNDKIYVCRKPDGLLDRFSFCEPD